MLIGAFAQDVSGFLEAANEEADFSMSLVCDASGLLIAVAGEGADEDSLAALTSLFEDIVHRSRRDLGFEDVDEVSMVDPQWGRLVVRPLAVHISEQLFLVVRVPHRKTWRRQTNQLKRQIMASYLRLDGT